MSQANVFIPSPGNKHVGPMDLSGFVYGSIAALW